MSRQIIMQIVAVTLGGMERGGVRAPETGRGWPVFVSDTVGSWWLQVSKLSKCLARAKKQRIAEEREHPDRARLAVGLG